MRNMKQQELKPCGICGQGLMHSGMPIFYRVQMAVYGVDAQSVQRQHGLEQVLGSAALAAVMGPDEDMAEVLNGPRNLLICHGCMMERQLVTLIGDGEDDEGGSDERV